VIIPQPFLRQCAKTKLIEEVISQQQLLSCINIPPKYSFACGVYSASQLITVASKHELKELSD
jgi:hypothetical protein